MRKYLLGGLACLFAVGLHAQIYYATDAIQGNPGHLNSDNEAPVGNGLPNDWSVILQANNSSPAWTAVQSIPFTFEFNNQTESSFKASSSGVITFDANTTMAAPGYTNFTLPNAGIPDKSVMVWGIQGTGSNDRIATKTFGTAPNRQFWIFFTSFSVQGSNNGYTYWSIVLEETTNQIYVVDQRNNTNALSATIGIQVNSSVGYSVTGSPNISTLSGTSGSNSDNYHYAFIPGPQPLVDMAAQNITNDDAIALNSVPITLQARFGNYGINNVTSATINYSINGGATVSAPLSGINLNSLSSTPINHPTAWSPSLGTYTVEMWISNPNGVPDPNSANDKVKKTIVISNSVGITENNNNIDVKVYPNPSTDYTFLQIESIKAQQATVEVVNELGMLLYKEIRMLDTGKQEIELKTSHFPTGLYFIKVELEDSISTLKVIVL